MKMNIDEKIEKIVEASLQGIPRNQIDIKGAGRRVRNILAGKRPMDATIEEMYENVLAYQKKQLLGKLNPIKADLSLSMAEKKAIIIRYAAKGVPKIEIDVAGRGSSVRSLEKGIRVSEEKLNQMYLNLVSYLEKGQCAKINYISTEEQLRAKIRTMENMMSGLIDRINCMEVAMGEMQKKLNIKENKKNKMKKTVMGLPVFLKTDIVRGKKYQRWYASYKENGRSYRIYIGEDIKRAKTKITCWLEKNKKGEELCVK